MKCKICNEKAQYFLGDNVFCSKQCQNEFWSSISLPLKSAFSKGGLFTSEESSIHIGILNNTATDTFVFKNEEAHSPRILHFTWQESLESGTYHATIFVRPYGPLGDKMASFVAHKFIKQLKTPLMKSRNLDMIRKYFLRVDRELYEVFSAIATPSSGASASLLIVAPDRVMLFEQDGFRTQILMADPEEDAFVPGSEYHEIGRIGTFGYRSPSILDLDSRRRVHDNGASIAFIPRRTFFFPVFGLPIAQPRVVVPPQDLNIDGSDKPLWDRVTKNDLLRGKLAPIGKDLKMNWWNAVVVGGDDYPVSRGFGFFKAKNPHFWEEHGAIQREFDQPSAVTALPKVAEFVPEFVARSSGRTEAKPNILHLGDVFFMTFENELYDILESTPLVGATLNLELGSVMANAKNESDNEDPWEYLTLFQNSLFAEASPFADIVRRNRETAFFQSKDGPELIDFSFCITFMYNTGYTLREQVPKPKPKPGRKAPQKPKGRKRRQ